MTQIGRTAGSI